MVRPYFTFIVRPASISNKWIIITFGRAWLSQLLLLLLLVFNDSIIVLYFDMMQLIVVISKRQFACRNLSNICWHEYRRFRLNLGKGSKMVILGRASVWTFKRQNQPNWPFWNCLPEIIWIGYFAIEVLFSPIGSISPTFWCIAQRYNPLAHMTEKVPFCFANNCTKHVTYMCSTQCHIFGKISTNAVPI